MPGPLHLGPSATGIFPKQLELDIPRRDGEWRGGVIIRWDMPRSSSLVCTPQKAGGRRRRRTLTESHDPCLCDCQWPGESGLMGGKGSGVRGTHRDADALRWLVMAVVGGARHIFPVNHSPSFWPSITSRGPPFPSSSFLEVSGGCPVLSRASATHLDVSSIQALLPLGPRLASSVPASSSRRRATAQHHLPQRRFCMHARCGLRQFVSGSLFV